MDTALQETPVNYSIDALWFSPAVSAGAGAAFALYTPAEKPLYARPALHNACSVRQTARRNNLHGMGYGFIMVIMAIGNFWFPQSPQPYCSTISRPLKSHSRLQTFIRYMNAINDYLYQHPERRAAGGQLTSAQLGLPATKNVSHLISQQRVFVWAKENPALWVPSRTKVVIRPLLARVENGRLPGHPWRRISITFPCCDPRSGHHLDELGRTLNNATDLSMNKNFLLL